MLPAIAFSDNTLYIERAFEEVVEYLEKLEAQFGKKPEITEKFKKREGESTKEFHEDEEDKGEEEEEERGGGKARFKAGIVEKRKIEREIERESLDARLEIVYTKVWPVDFNYSLRRRTDSLDSEGIRYWVSRMLSKLDMKANHIYVRGLARGIAIYHAGVPKPYRDLVEALFRSGNIQFVISTQALAVGVNMPCKTVVFLTDSRFIHKVEFEQMRGRAGRRGFDHVGNTVFCWFSPSRVSHLLLSPMQPLLAIPAISLDSVMRAIILRSHVRDKESVTRAVGRWLYTHPSMEATRDVNPPVIFLFAIELLFRLHLINKEGNPIGLSGLVSHNFDMYPANYAISYLIQVGALDEIVEPFKLSSKATKEQIQQALVDLITIFAYLTGRIRAQKGSQRVVPPLPTTIMTCLETYNTIISDCVEDCSEALGTAHELPAPHIDLVSPALLNGYAVDFFKFKQIQIIVKDNHLSDNQAYRAVKQFAGFLMKVKTAVSHGVSDPLNPLCRATTTLADKFNGYVDNIVY